MSLQIALQRNCMSVTFLETVAVQTSIRQTSVLQDYMELAFIDEDDMNIRQKFSMRTF